MIDSYGQTLCLSIKLTGYRQCVQDFKHEIQGALEICPGGLMRLPFCRAIDKDGPPASARRAASAGVRVRSPGPAGAVAGHETLLRAAVRWPSLDTSPADRHRSFRE
jgi:hypothetical protein